MVLQALNTLKKNPVLIVFYLSFVAVTLALTLIMIPGKMDIVDSSDLLVFGLRYLSAMLIAGILTVIFFSGYLYQVAQAVKEGTADAASFLIGIKQFLLRFLLATLLFLALGIGFSFIIGTVSLPITVFTTALTEDNTVLANSALVIITTLFMILAFPFVILWLPAVFLDNVGPLEGLKRGAHAGKKNYLFLALISLIAYLPSTLYNLLFILPNQAQLEPDEIKTPDDIIQYFSELNPSKIFYEPSYWGMFVVSAALLLLVIVTVFIVYYHENREKKLV